MNCGSAGGQVPVESGWFNNTSKKTRVVKRTIRVFKSSEQNINHSATAETLPILVLAETLTPHHLLQRRSRFNEQHVPEGCGGRMPGGACCSAHGHGHRAAPGVPPPRRARVPSLAPQRHTAVPEQRLQEPEPPVHPPWLPPPSLLRSNPWGCGSSAPELGWHWKCRCELKQGRNGGRLLYCSCRVVWGEISLFP